MTYYEEKLRSGEIKDTDEWITFNGFCFPMLPGVRYFMDGNPGNGRTLFIEDDAETFEISFGDRKIFCCEYIVSLLYCH